MFPEKKGFLRYSGTTPRFYNYLKGKIWFLGMVRGASDPMFLKYKNKYEELLMKNNEPIPDQVTRPRLYTLPEDQLIKLFKIWEEAGIENAINQYAKSVWTPKN